MDYIEDKTDFFEVPDLMISWKWLKTAFPEKAQDLKIVEDHYLMGYTLLELAEMNGLRIWQVRNVIKDTLEFAKTQMTT